MLGFWGDCHVIGTTQRTTQIQTAPGKPGLQLTLCDPQVTSSAPPWSSVASEEGKGAGTVVASGIPMVASCKKQVFVNVGRKGREEDSYLLLAPLMVGRVLLLLGRWGGRPAPPLAQSRCCRPCATPPPPPAPPLPPASPAGVLRDVFLRRELRELPRPP